MELVERAKDSATVKRVFGDPIQQDGVTVIPVARVVQGGGGGMGRQEVSVDPDAAPGGEGSGGGFGLSATPAGVFVVKDGDVEEDTLKKHVKDNLARYKVPREIIFLDELPRNATGKVLKKDLKDYDADGEGDS